MNFNYSINVMALSSIFTFCLPDFKKFARMVAWRGLHNNVIYNMDDNNLTKEWEKIKSMDALKESVDSYHFDHTSSDFLLKNQYLDLYIDIVCEEKSFLTANFLFKFKPKKGEPISQLIHENLEKLKDHIILKSSQSSPTPAEPAATPQANYQTILDEYKKTVISKGYFAADKALLKIEQLKKKPSKDLKREVIEIFVGTSGIMGAGLGIFTKHSIPENTIIGTYGGQLSIFAPEEGMNMGKGTLEIYDSQTTETPDDEDIKEYLMTFRVILPKKKTNIQEYYVCPSKKQVTEHKHLSSELMDDPNNEIKKNKVLQNMNWTALLNDNRNSNNVKIILGGYLLTTSKVNQGKELFLDYGWEYWYPDGKHTYGEPVYISSDVMQQAKENSAVLC